jgi:hypothetical protein
MPMVWENGTKILIKKFESEGSKNVRVFPETFQLIPRKQWNVSQTFSFVPEFLFSKANISC